MEFLMLIQISVLVICAISFLPESPVWLRSKKKLKRAEASCAWLKLETQVVKDVQTYVSNPIM